jgi:purine-cytosine permease-like protein
MAVHLDSMSVFGVSLSRNITIVVGVVLIGFLIIRRPERAGAWIRGIFEMVADIAASCWRASIQRSSRPTRIR